MGFSITGYVLEPPRVGQSNSPSTSSPNNFVSDSVAYNLAYPTAETNPRDDYLVVATSEGGTGLLANANFGWTKNEIVRRFDYSTRDGRFETLPGGAIVTVGPLGPNSNTQRLTVPAPLQVLSSAPFRLSIGTTGGGITQTVTLVPNDGAFGSPPVGTTELSQSTGNLNWNPSDLTTYNGQLVRFQQQGYFDFDKSTGDIGLVSDPAVLLNPIPGTGQFPLIRIGFGLYLTPVERPNEAGFSVNPTAGTVEWALTTGRLKFNSGDVSAHTGVPVYYDGTLFALTLQLPRQSIGTVASPTPIVGLPPQGGDLIFALPSHSPYVQFSTFVYVTSFDPIGKQGEVQINAGTGVVQFSLADRLTYGSTPVQVIFGDLPVDHGISLRLFRTAINLDASQAGVKDVTVIYSVTNAVWANPIISSPQVLLPSIPIDDVSFPITVNVAQGTGTFVGSLSRLDVPSPPPGLGYFIDFTARTFNYAQRKTQVLVPILQTSGAVTLPDPLVLPTNVVLELETAPGTNVFSPLTIGTSALFDGTSGVVSFASTQGVSETAGTLTSFSGTTLTDTAADFITAGIQHGDFVLVSSSVAKGVYTVNTVTSAAQLTTDVVAQMPSLTGPPTPVSVSNASYSILRGREIVADRFFEPVSLIDPSTMVERIRSLGTIQNATTVVLLQSATFPDFLTLSDSVTDFIVAGVQVGDTVLLNSGPDSGSTRSITSVSQHQVTISASSPFTTLASATYSIVRRLHIPTSGIGTSRFRYGAVNFTFSTVVNTVSTDSAFTPPTSLPQGTVEVSQTTGNLNFSQADVNNGGSVFWVHKLTPQVDYQISPQLGFIQFTDRLLALEEALITYTPAPPTTSPPTPPGLPIQERATFLVRKELVQPHPTPTSVLSFNPSGRTVATSPTQAVFRGGRPQQVGVQCTVDTNISTITFLPDDHLTDALPHGAIINPNERVLIDYYIYQAIGGEKTTTVLQSPMLTAQVFINQGTNNFVVHGDQTSVLQAGFLLRIETQEIYMIGSVAFDAPSNTTTVTLFGNQTFQDSFTDPQLFVSSGPVRLTGILFFPAYFVTELQAFDPIARGMNKVFLFGDRTASYRTGTVLYFTDGLTTFSDFVQVTGAQYHPETGKTEVTLASNTIRQYVMGSQFLSYSVRPILENAATTAQTSLIPALTQPTTIYRREEGQAGILLSPPTDYTIDDSGSIQFAPPLRPLEELGIFYTGHQVIQAGRTLRASYTCSIVPTDLNGLLGQILKANYSIFSPDSFYYRVETMTNFKGELAAEIEQNAQSSVPSSGPQTSNASSPQLFQQGRESSFFQEEHLANQDLVARASLKFFNDAVNSLEDALQAFDGRVVGDSSGRFKFDGNIDNPIRPNLAAVTNQIDDILQVFIPPFPIPGFQSQLQSIFLPSPTSRFYPTRRTVFGGPVGSGPFADGDTIIKLPFGNLTSTPQFAFKRWPRAQILQSYPAGNLTFVVDNANGTSDALLRPAFVTNMRIVIEDAAGFFYINDAAHVTVTAVLSSPERITISSGSAFAIPAGATIYMAPSDANTILSDGAQNGYEMLYEFGKSVGINLEKGELLFIKRKFPFDGSLPTTLIPKILYINEVQTGDILQANGMGLTNTLTSPYKFPALYGGTTNDDSDQSVPIVGPTFNGELTPAGGGPLYVENAAELPVTGTLRTSTTAPYVGTGSLDVTRSIITDANISFPSPAPKIYDLVRILNGLNGATEFRRVSFVLGNQILVDSPFTFQDTGFTYTVAVSSTTVTGTATLAGTTLTDGVATFLSTVQVGWTVVMTSGANAAERRQVVSILSNTQLTLDSAFSSPLVGGTYRVDNPLDTYGGTGSILSSVSSAVATELTAIGNEQTALLNFFSTVFTTLISSPNGTVLSLSQLTDVTVNFITSDITTSDFVYVQTGAEAGIYPISSINSATQLTVGTPFPGLSGSFSYQIVKSFGSSLTTFQDIFSILAANATFTTQTQAFQTLINTSVPVLLAGVSDPAAFARGIMTSDLNTRSTQVSNRISYLNDPANGPIAKIQKALLGSDRLYDKRYSWIDGRINLETGYLVKQQRAAAQRLKDQLDTVNQLIKLITVQGS